MGEAHSANEAHLEEGGVEAESHHPRFEKPSQPFSHPVCGLPLMQSDSALMLAGVLFGLHLWVDQTQAWGAVPSKMFCIQMTHQAGAWPGRVNGTFSPILC